MFDSFIRSACCRWDGSTAQSRVHNSTISGSLRCSSSPVVHGSGGSVYLLLLFITRHTQDCSERFRETIIRSFNSVTLGLNRIAGHHDVVLVPVTLTSERIPTSGRYISPSQWKSRCYDEASFILRLQTVLWAPVRCRPSPSCTGSMDEESAKASSEI